MKVKHRFQYHYEDYIRHVDESSETIPDQSFTVKEILERFSSAMPPTGIIRNVAYDDDPESDMDDDYISPDSQPSLDLTDLQDYKKQYSDGIRKYRNLSPEEQKQIFDK